MGLVRVFIPIRAGSKEMLHIGYEGNERPPGEDACDDEADLQKIPPFLIG
jgi:hypothetical protein